MSSTLKLQKRLAASVLGVGKRRVWLDPLEINEISMANSRKNIRKLVKDGFIIKKPKRMHSRARVRKRLEAKDKGRHTGFGKRKGTKEARMPQKILWIRRTRVLRRLLVKYRSQKKLDKHLYHELYMKVKGNVFKNKRVLMEHIFRAKTEKARAKHIEDQAAIHRQRNKAARERRNKRLLDRHRVQAEGMGAAPEPETPEEAGEEEEGDQKDDDETRLRKTSIKLHPFVDTFFKNRRPKEKEFMEHYVALASAKSFKIAQIQRRSIIRTLSQTQQRRKTDKDVVELEVVVKETEGADESVTVGDDVEQEDDDDDDDNVEIDDGADE